MSRKRRPGCHVAFGRASRPVAGDDGGRCGGALLDRRRLLTIFPAAAVATAAHASNTAVRLDFRFGAWTAFAAWSERLRRHVETWWPVMTTALASRGSEAADVVRVEFITVTPEIAARLRGTPLYRRLDLHVSEVAAITRGDTVHVNAPFLLARLDDPDMFGMMAHELTHVVQAYPHGAATWLAEGVADYVRYYVLLPDDPRRAFDGATANYDDGYQATAALLAFVERSRPGAVRAVNAALRAGRDGAAVLQRYGGADLQTLWRACLAARAEPASLPPSVN